MRTKISILSILTLTLVGAGGFYLAEHLKLERVDNEVRAWQTRLGDYVTFDYAAISTRLWSDTVSLEDVYITYPILMSMDKLTLISKAGDSVLEKFTLEIEGINFTLPSASDSFPWYGNMQIDYEYDPVQKQMDLQFSPNFPALLKGDVRTTLQGITPDIDLVFNYPNVLLAALRFELQNLGFLQTMGWGNTNDPQLMNWMTQLTQKNQRQAFEEFWTKGAALDINFSPEYPVPLYRLLENEKLFWQHPAVSMQAKLS